MHIYFMVFVGFHANSSLQQGCTGRNQYTGYIDSVAVFLVFTVVLSINLLPSLSVNS
jgi:hypothetical protein